MMPTKMGSMAATCLTLFILMDTNKVICYPIAFKFHIYFALINLLDKFKNGFCPHDHQNGHPLSFHTCGHNNNFQSQNSFISLVHTVYS